MPDARRRDPCSGGQLFATGGEALREEIEHITGVAVREATAEIGPEAGTVIQVYLLARSVPADIWNSDEPGYHLGANNKPDLHAL